MIAVWLVLIAAVFPFCAAMAQSPLPPGPLDLNPQRGETATARAGGPDGVYVSRDTLRCTRPEEAIVGFRTRRGSVLDYLQIVCVARTMQRQELQLEYVSLDGIRRESGRRADERAHAV